MVARVTTQAARLDTFAHQDRRLIRVAGADLRRFLQGLLSADIEALRPGHGCPSAILTVKGKLVSEAIVLCDAEGAIALAVPGEIADAVVELIDRHIIMDDVTIALDAAQRFALVWPGYAGAAGVTGYATRHPAPGVLLVGEEGALAAALAKVTVASEDAWNRYRVGEAAPAWGHEIVADTFPPEVGFVAAVSYDKGCYMGQEPLARIHARGQVNRVMVRVSAGTLPAGPVTLAASDRPVAGRWTTWASDPAGAIGLAVVHRSVAVPGTVLTGEGVGPVTVTSGPLGDDPGVGGKAKVATVQLGKR